MRTFFIIIALFFLNITVAQRLKSSGNWNESFGATEIENAGYDYDSYYESKSNQTKLTITPIPNSWYNKYYMPFTVFVYKEDQNWNENLNLEVKVSSTDHGNSSGTQYQSITNYSTQFFDTVGRRTNIPIQYRISGLSVTIPAETYSVEIVYTVLNL